MDCLHAIFRFGIKLELTSNDPMKRWEKPREKQREMQLTIDDLAKIYNASSEHLKWIIEVEWELGTRPGRTELFALKWSDIDFDGDLLRVRGTKTKTSNRLMPLTPAFKARLLEKRDKSESNYVIEYRGKPITSCKTAFKKACDKANLNYNVRLYDIRHLFASTILANGGDLMAVSKLLGHSSTRMTASTYYHELKGEKALALARKPVLTI
jgi:integrase